MRPSKQQNALNKRGQYIGNKGDRSRQRLMDGAFAVLKQKSIWEVSVTDICATSKVAPSNLYTYFGGVEELVLALARQVAARHPPLAEQLQGSWDGRTGLSRARKIVDMSFAYWSENRPVLKVVELLADEGNAAFDEVRASRLLPVHGAMQALVAAAQRQGQLSKRLAPDVVAISAMNLIESAAMHLPLIVQYGHSLQDVRETQARLLLLHLTGRDGA